MWSFACAESVPPTPPCHAPTSCPLNSAILCPTPLLTDRCRRASLQVFLRVGHETGAHEADLAAETKSEADEEVKRTLTSRSDGLAMRHFGAMMTKRLKYFKRDCQSWCCQLILPLLLLILGILLYTVSGTADGFTCTCTHYSCTFSSSTHAFDQA